MTVNEIFKDCLALGLETSDDNGDFNGFILPHFNLLLAEMFHYNNIARERAGKDALESIPVVVSLEEENPYETVFNSAMVYGLFTKLMIADGDTELAPTYLQLYYTHRDSALKAEYAEVTDYYESDFY